MPDSSGRFRNSGSFKASLLISNASISIIPLYALFNFSKAFVKPTLLDNSDNNLINIIFKSSKVILPSFLANPGNFVDITVASVALQVNLINFIKPSCSKFFISLAL